MSKFFEDTMQGLLEALEIEKGNIALTEKPNMPGKTFYVADNDKELIKISEFRQWLEEQLKDPEFKKEWDASQPEFEKIRREIESQREKKN